MLSEEFAAWQEAQAPRDQSRPPPPEATRNVSSGHTDDGDRAADTLQGVGDGDGSFSPTRAPQDDVDATPDESELTDGRMPSVPARTPNRARFRWRDGFNPDDPALRHRKLADAVLECTRPIRLPMAQNGFVGNRSSWPSRVQTITPSSSGIWRAPSSSLVSMTWRITGRRSSRSGRGTCGSRKGRADAPLTSPPSIINFLAVIVKAEYDGEGLREAPTPGTRTPRNNVRGRQEAQEVLDAAWAVATGAVGRNLQETRSVIDNQPEGAEDDDVIDIQAGQPERPNPRARVSGRARTVAADGLAEAARLKADVDREAIAAQAENLKMMWDMFELEREDRKAEREASEAAERGAAEEREKDRAMYRELLMSLVHQQRDDYLVLETVEVADGLSVLRYAVGPPEETVAQEAVGVGLVNPEPDRMKQFRQLFQLCVEPFSRHGQQARRIRETAEVR